MNRGIQSRAVHVPTHQALLACHHCDLVQYEAQIDRNANAYCIRCGALLYRGTRTRLDWLIALTAGDTLMFIASNLFPIASMEVEGVHTSTTLTGTALALYHQGRPLVAGLVFITTVLLPFLQLVVLLYLLIPLRTGQVPPGVSTGFRFLLAARPWNMIEVFLLGLLVTLVKLSDLATVVPGVALWAFVGSVILSSAISASFNTRDFWACLETTQDMSAHAAAWQDTDAPGMRP